MNRLFALGIAALFVAAVIPSAEAADREERHSYIPGPSLVTVIWCSEAEHALIPLEPTDPWLDNPDGWLFSGEPECAPHDVANAAREAQGDDRTTGGYGGSAFSILEDEILRPLSSTTDDDVFGVGQSYQYLAAYSESGNDAIAEGCGPQTVTVPEDPEVHWQSAPDDPLYLAWVYIDAAGVDPVTLAPCFSSTGTVIGTFA